jgi:hypothetical protein
MSKLSNLLLFKLRYHWEKGPKIFKIILYLFYCISLWFIA